MITTILFLPNFSPWDCADFDFSRGCPVGASCPTEVSDNGESLPLWSVGGMSELPGTFPVCGRVSGAPASIFLSCASSSGSSRSVVAMMGMSARKGKEMERFRVNEDSRPEVASPKQRPLPSLHGRKSSEAGQERGGKCHRRRMHQMVTMEWVQDEEQ